MFTAQQYRSKEIEYSKLVKIASSPNEIREYQRLERVFAELADNAQWAVDNQNRTVHATETEEPSALASPTPFQGDRAGQ
jgi:hypothetical protein